MQFLQTNKGLGSKEGLGICFTGDWVISVRLGLAHMPFWLMTADSCGRQRERGRQAYVKRKGAGIAKTH